MTAKKKTTKTRSSITTREKNLSFWNSVEKTDPSFTKHVSFGRGFTSIDAHYQMREATAKWGMLGQGWGVKVEDVSNSILVDPSLSALMVTIWYKDEEGNKCYGVPIIASAPKLRGEKADDDVFKKITTDGITKGLSYFGFNADVFLGKFDDNKYVKELEKEFNETKEAEEVKETKEVKDVVDFSPEAKSQIRESQELAIDAYIMFDEDGSKTKLIQDVLDYWKVKGLSECSNNQIEKLFARIQDDVSVVETSKKKPQKTNTKGV